MAGTSVEKAWFWSEEIGKKLVLQYNPKDFKFDKPVSWKEHDHQGKQSGVEFQKAEPAIMQADLYFDTTDTNEDVRTTWVNALLEFTNPVVKPKE